MRGELVGANRGDHNRGAKILGGHINGRSRHTRLSGSGYRCGDSICLLPPCSLILLKVVAVVLAGVRTLTLLAHVAIPRVFGTFQVAVFLGAFADLVS